MLEYGGPHDGKMMFVGTCSLELLLAEGNSLKEKRQVVRSIVERLKSRFNISIAEIGYLESTRRAEIGLAAVSSDTVYLEKLISKVINFVELDGRVQVTGISREVI